MSVQLVNTLWVIAGPVFCLLVYGYIILSLYLEDRRAAHHPTPRHENLPHL